VRSNIKTARGVKALAGEILGGQHDARSLACRMQCTPQSWPHIQSLSYLDSWLMGGISEPVFGPTQKIYTESAVIVPICCSEAGWRNI
jgi:hypothetical protein